MKEKFFREYAGRLEAFAQADGGAFPARNKLVRRWETAAVYATRLHFAVEFNHPIIEKRAAFPVVPLMADIATMTAIGNDARFFARICRSTPPARLQPGDMALAFSTSGKSPNLIYALEAAREKADVHRRFCRQGRRPFPDVADYCFIVPSFSIHRIQEVHATLVHVLWDLIHIALERKMSSETSTGLTGDASSLARSARCRSTTTRRSFWLTAAAGS